MKSFLQLFVLICCASLSSNAQSITFNSPPSTSQVCDSTLFEAYFTATSDTFTITIQAKVWNNNTLVSLPHPDCANGLSGNNPVIAGLNTVLSNTSCAADISAPLYNDTANSFTWTVILNANCSSSVEVFFYYYIKLDCSLFPDSGAFNQFNLIQNLTASSSTGNITTGITFPYFPPISSPVQVDANYGQQSTMIFPYENTGAAAAHINFSFQDLYVNNCTNAAYRVDSVHYDTGAVAPSVYTKELYAGFNNSIVVPAHKFLYVIQYITIINCPDSCLSAPKKSMFKWQCANRQAEDFCNQCQDSIVADFVLNTETPTYTIDRITPDSLSVLYDSTCFGETQKWKVRVKNTSLHTVLPLLTVNMANGGFPGSLSVVHQSTLKDSSFCDSCIVTIDSLITSTIAVCNNPGDSSIGAFEINISNFAPGDSVFFYFDTYKCCGSDRGFGDNIIFNHWVVQSSALTGCNNTISSDSGNFALPGSVGAISSHYIGSTRDIHQEVNHDPYTRPINLTVPKDSLYGPYSVQVMSLDSLFGNQFDKQVLGYSPTNPRISGILKAEVFCRSGLLIEDMAQHVSLINDSITLQPFATYTTRHDSACEDAYYYFLYSLDSTAYHDDILKGAKFNLQMRTCCPSDSVSDYMVKFSLLPNASCAGIQYSTNPIYTDSSIVCSNSNCCWLPLDSAGFFINVQCPGCRSAGAIVQTYKMQRNSFGYQDIDNNQAADGSAPLLIDPTYAKFDSLNRDAAVHGDDIIDHLTAYFFDGDDTNIDTSANPNPYMQGYTLTGFMIPKNINLHNLQLHRVIPLSDTTKMDLQVSGLDFYVDSLVEDTALHFCVDCDGFTDLRILETRTLFKLAIPQSLVNSVLERQGNDYLFSFTDSLIHAANTSIITSYLGFNTDSFAYGAGQQYRLSVRYKACGNIHNSSSDVTEQDVAPGIVITNNMWLTGKGFLLGTILGADQQPNLIFDIDTNNLLDMQSYELVFEDSALLDTAAHCLSCDTANQSNFGDSFRFYCETFSAGFRFLSTDLFSSVTYNIVHNASCYQGIYMQAVNSFGHSIMGTNYFPFEYKPPAMFPHTWKIDSIPTGYSIHGPVIRFSQFTNNSIPINNIFNTIKHTIDPSFINVSGITLTIDSLPYDSIAFIKNLVPTITDSFPQLLIADESSSQIIQVLLLPDCSVAPGIIGVLHSHASIGFTENHTAVSIPAIDTAINCGDIFYTQNKMNDGGHWVSPNPNLILTFQAPTIFATTQQVCWKFKISNPYSAPMQSTGADNIFINVPPTGFFGQWSAQFGTYPFTTPVDSGIIGLTPFLQSSHADTGKICARYTSCVASDSIDFTWGWNCESYPITVLDSALCDRSLDTARVYLNNTRTSLLPGDTEAPEILTLCNPVSDTLRACFYNLDIGAAIPFAVNLFNSPNLQVDAVILKSCNPAITNIALLGSGATSFAITPAHIDSVVGHPYLTKDDSIIIEVLFFPLCQLAPYFKLPDMELLYHSYCDSVDTLSVPAAFDSVPLGTNCSNCFVITKTATPANVTADTLELVYYTISVCANNSFVSTYNIWETYPSGYIPNGPDPFNGGATTITATLGAHQCDTFLVQGFLTDSACNIVHVDDAQNNPVSSDTACVNVLPSCRASADYTINHKDPISYLNTIAAFNAANSYDVRGLLIIDQIWKTSGKIFYMEPGSSIQIYPGISFQSTACIFVNCSKMWKGIKLDSAAIFYDKSSNISGAQYAVSGYKGIVLLENSYFIDNFVSVKMENGMSLFTQGCNFIGTGTMPINYTAQSPATGNYPFTGIESFNTPLSVSPPWDSPNYFTNMSNGIIGYDCDITVKDCVFKLMQPDTVYDSLTVASFGANFNGSGIAGISAYPDYTLEQGGFGTSIWVDKSFVNCNYAIFGQGIRVFSYYNRIDSTNTPYHLRYCKNKNEIAYNLLNAWQTGVELLFCDGGFQNSVRNNIITFGNRFNNLPSYGVRIEEGNTHNENSEIVSNEIYFMPDAINAYRAISLNAADSFFVTANNIYMHDNSRNHNGIFTSGCVYPNISCNTITGSSSSYDTSSTQSAITNQMGAEVTIGCNVMDQTNNGIYIVGPILKTTDILGNVFNEHCVGLRYSQSALTNDLNFRGNTWQLQIPQSSGWLAWNENPGYDPQVHWNDVGNLSSAYPNIIYQNPPGWFRPAAGSDFLCDQGVGPIYCSNYEPCTECQRSFDGQIASGNLLNNPYTDETKWMLKKGLFEKLSNDNSLLADTLMQSFYNQVQNSVIADFKIIDDSKQNLFIIDSTHSTIIDQNNIEIDSSLAGIHNKIIDLKLALDSNYYTNSIVDDIVEQHQIVQNAKSDNENILSVEKDVRVVKTDNLNTLNNNLIISENIATNEQQVNNIYLTTIARGVYSFPTNQVNCLTSIANQCPLSGGNAVFRARALLALINTSLIYDDKSVCISDGIALRTGKAEDIKPLAKLYPNPANESATLIYDIDSGCNSKFILFNSLGQQVLSFNLNSEIKRLQFSTNQLHQGMYHYSILCNSNLIGSGKLGVIH